MNLTNSNIVPYIRALYTVILKRQAATTGGSVYY